MTKNFETKLKKEHAICKFILQIPLLRGIHNLGKFKIENSNSKTLQC